MNMPATNPRLVRSIAEHKWIAAEETAMRTGKYTIADQRHDYIWIVCLRGQQTQRLTLKLY